MGFSYLQKWLAIAGLILLSTVANKTVAQPTKEWERQLNGYANEMVIDSSGNIIISGRRSVSNEVIVTAKYSPQGQLLWEKTYDGEPGSINSPEALAVDKLGNIYVTGFTDTLPLGESDQEYLTLKYSPTGNLLWSKRYNNPQSSYLMDVAHAVAIDNNLNVYVTGESDGAVTIKYDSIGNEVWLKQFGTSSYGENILVDAEGNIVTLISTLVQSGLDNHVVKYTADGILLWSTLFKSLGCTTCFNKLMDDDMEGNIYALGEKGLHKLNKNGVLQWIYKSPYIEGHNVVKVDARQNILVSGKSSYGMDSSIFAVAKVDPQGNQLMADSIIHNSRNLRAVDIAVDNNSNAYFSSNFFYDGGISFHILLKYDSTGTKIWKEIYSSPDFITLQANSIAVDSSYNIYVFGQSKDQDEKQFLNLVKYQQTLQQYGVCCFDNGNGSQLVCGKNVTPLNCASSGKNAFFVGYFDDCKSLDTINVCNPQPSSINFEANYNQANSSVQLQWNHSANTNGYYVQRSTDGKNYRTIAFVESKNSALTYKDPYPEMQNYYKLTWFEPSRFESKERLVVILNNNKLMVYPNPAINSIRIVHKEMEQQHSTIWILDDMGRIKYTQKIPAGRTQEISVKQLPAGTYFIKAAIRNKSYKQIFIKR